MTALWHPRGECDLKLFGRIKRKKIKDLKNGEVMEIRSGDLILFKVGKRVKSFSITSNLTVGYATWAGGRTRLAYR